jgi:hypothetical protein
LERFGVGSRGRGEVVAFLEVFDGALGLADAKLGFVEGRVVGFEVALLC